MFYRPVLGNGDESFIHCLGYSQLKDLCVSTLDVSLLVSLSGSHAKGPGTIEASLLFVAVCVCTIVFANKLKVGVWTHLFEPGHSLFVLKLNVVLNMRSARLSFLKLACHIHYAGLLGPSFQEPFWVNALGVVQSTNDCSSIGLYRRCTLYHLYRRLL